MCSGTLLHNPIGKVSIMPMYNPSHPGELIRDCLERRAGRYRSAQRNSAWPVIRCHGC